MAATRDPIGKLADKVRDAVSDLLGTLAPQPEPVPIPIRDHPRARR